MSTRTLIETLGACAAWIWAAASYYRGWRDGFDTADKP